MANIYFASEVKPADPATKAFRIVLHDTFGPLATHVQTMDDKAMHWGHYFGENTSENMEHALADFRARCAKYELKEQVK